jgi:hypothetical protein
MDLRILFMVSHQPTLLAASFLNCMPIPSAYSGALNNFSIRTWEIVTKNDNNAIGKLIEL